MKAMSGASAILAVQAVPRCRVQGDVVSPTGFGDTCCLCEPLNGILDVDVLWYQLL